MHPHRGLEVALLTKRKPPLQPQQVFGCDKDPTDPWLLQLHMHGPWMYMNWPVVVGAPDGVEHYRSEWQVHTDVVPYKEYPWHTAGSTHPDDQRVLLPRGTGNCKTYSLVGVDMEHASGVLYFKSRMFASPPGSLGAWDLSWTTTIVTSGGNSNDLLLNIWSDDGYGIGLRAFSGYLHYAGVRNGWVPLATWPTLPHGEYTRTVEFRCLLASSWCRVHVNGSTHTLDYGDAFKPGSIVTVELVRTNGPSGGTVSGVHYGRTIQVSDIAVVSAPANKFIDYPWD